MQVSFSQRSRRRGSTHPRCRLSISGDWQPRLEIGDWQEIAAESPDGRFVGLVRWDERGDTPGFRLVVLDRQAERVYRGRRVSGACTALHWSGGGFAWRSSLRRQGRFAGFNR